MRRPSVSVVIPCYRYGRFLAACVGSVLDQDGVDVRVLIIDDASPDDSFDVAAALARSDDRIEARRHRVNRGHIATYNEGLLGWAAGTYSVLLSADDLLTPGALARATAIMEAESRVGLVYGHALSWTDGTPLPPARGVSTGATIWRGHDWLGIVCALGHSVIASPEAVVRTSVQQRIGGYLPSLPHSGDAEMWMRFAVHADIAYVKGADQAYYRAHGANMTNRRGPLIDLQQRQAAYDAVLGTYADRLTDAGRLRARVGRTLAKEALWTACRAPRGSSSAAVADLAAFAGAAYPATRRLPEYWGLRWREAVGPTASAMLAPLALSAVHRRVRRRMWWRRWARQGV